MEACGGPANAGRRSRLRLLVSASALALGVACTSTTAPRSPSTLGRSLPTSTSTATGDFLSGPCPVTEPVSRKEIPKPVVESVLGAYRGSPVENIGNWYGNDSLWVELPPRSTVVKPSGEKLSEKFPWVRLIRGSIRIVGQRLDGPAPPARGEASTGNGPIGFNSSGIAFPTTGCWRITGTIAARDLTFVVKVERSS
jgi:hypothetical protein